MRDEAIFTLNQTMDFRFDCEERALQEGVRYDGI